MVPKFLLKSHLYVGWKVYVAYHVRHVIIFIDYHEYSPKDGKVFSFSSKSCGFSSVSVWVCSSKSTGIVVKEHEAVC